MPKLKNGVTDPTKFFNVDGIDYPMIDYTIEYDQVERNSSGVLDETKVRIGISNKFRKGNKLVQDSLVSDWTDSTDTPYASLALLLAALAEFMGFNTSSGGSGDSVLTNPVENVYANITALLADQGNQTTSFFQYVIDATDDPNISSGDAYYEKLSNSTTTLATDYRRLSDTEETILLTGSNSYRVFKISDIQDDTSPLTSVSGGKIGVEYDTGTGKVTGFLFNKITSSSLVNLITQSGSIDFYINIYNKKSNTYENAIITGFATVNTDFQLVSVVNTITAADLSVNDRLEVYFDNGLFEPNVWRPKLLTSNTSQQNADLINADIISATSVDGVVILPAGTFEIRTINWNPRVFLKGAGRRNTTLIGTNAEPLISYVDNTIYFPAGKIEGMRLRGGVDENNKISTSGLFIHAILIFNISEIMFEFIDGNAIELLGWEVGQIVSCGFHKCNGGINAARDLTTDLGPLDVNIMSITNCLFQRLPTWAIQWNRGSNITFEGCDFSTLGTTGNASTGIMKFVNFCPNGESIGFNMNNCWNEDNFGTFLNIESHNDSKHSIRNSTFKFGSAPELGISLDGGQLLIDNSEFAWDIDILDGVLETRNATIGGAITLTGTATHKKNTTTNLTGVEIDLGCVIGTNYNFASAESGTTYTTINKVEGGFANCLINTTSEPTVTGGTKIAGFTWVTGTDIELVIEVKNALVRYFFLEI